MRFLAIETSCDETAVALVESGEDEGFAILAHEISSQVELHEKYGGVVPELASREHLSNLPLLIDSVLRSTATDLEDLAAIIVTQGPGLKGCLLVGICMAQGIALAHGIPLVAVNHIEGHLLAPFLDNPGLAFPYLALVVSGGHTELVEARGLGDYHIVARTSDDAAGEAFDKSAHLLGFPYPGGPRLAALADVSGNSRFQLPKVMRESAGFSFSGLKTAISLLIAKNRTEFLANEEVRGALCRAVQDSIVDALVFKLKRALDETGIRRVVVTGGVAANRTLRQRVSELQGVEVFFPSMLHCTDNAAMIAYVGVQRFLRGERASFDIEPVSRWPIEQLS